MGQSVMARIWFGLCWEEKYYENGLPNVVISHMKLQNPTLEDSYDVENAVRNKISQFDCQLVNHCYD